MSFTVLPPYVQSRTLSLVDDVQTLNNCSLVCKQWHSLINDDFWEGLRKFYPGLESMAPEKGFKEFLKENSINGHVHLITSSSQLVKSLEMFHENNSVAKNTRCTYTAIDEPNFKFDAEYYARNIVKKTIDISAKYLCTFSLSELNLTGEICHDRPGRQIEYTFMVDFDWTSPSYCYPHTVDKAAPRDSRVFTFGKCEYKFPNAMMFEHCKDMRDVMAEQLEKNATSIHDNTITEILGELYKKFLLLRPFLDYANRS